MTGRRLLVLAFVVAAIAAWVLLIGSPSPQDRQAGSLQLFEEGVCSDEAVLLAAAQDVVAQPGGDQVITLPANAGVYVCDESNGYRRVVYPEPSTHVDCSTRQKNVCEVGYISIPFEVHFAG